MESQEANEHTRACENGVTAEVEGETVSMEVLNLAIGSDGVGGVKRRTQSAATRYRFGIGGTANDVFCGAMR